MIPIEKISLLIEYIFYIKASGGIYRGVPTLYFVLIYASDRIANPKSAIFHLFPDLNILAGFKSLCIMLFWHRYLYPSMISFTILIASL